MKIEFLTNKREFLTEAYLGWEYYRGIRHVSQEGYSLVYRTKLVKSRALKPKRWYIIRDDRQISYINKRGDWRTTTAKTYVPFKADRNGNTPKRISYKAEQKSLRECTIQINPNFKQLLSDFGLKCKFEIIKVAKDKTTIKWTLDTKQIDLDELLRAIKSFCPKTETLIRDAIVSGGTIAERQKLEQQLERLKKYQSTLGGGNGQEMKAYAVREKINNLKQQIEKLRDN